MKLMILVALLTISMNVFAEENTDPDLQDKGCEGASADGDQKPGKDVGSTVTVPTSEPSGEASGQ